MLLCNICSYSIFVIWSIDFVSFAFMNVFILVFLSIIYLYKNKKVIFFSCKFDLRIAFDVAYKTHAAMLSFKKRRYSTYYYPCLFVFICNSLHDWSYFSLMVWISFVTVIVLIMYIFFVRFFSVLLNLS